ncbi:barstar family protein [Streptomyces sp. SID13726]|uniref:barstar family protein n=1 Tax=Streptomyces sp. SID13726 TaxID=2706058 RepID=UPI0013B616B7|nr:barstar family protein [Streptomyces sp. SID13726]NEB05199.1 barstar family protein [Streptomyces sp. SID13726]
MTARVVTLDLDGVTDKADLMDRCARDLPLPDYFGRNWDALADVLSDPGVWSGDSEDFGGSGDSGDGVDKETVVVVRHWERYARTRPDEWETAREVFAQASAITVALALG